MHCKVGCPGGGFLWSKECLAQFWTGTTLGKLEQMQTAELCVDGSHLEREWVSEQRVGRANRQFLEGEQVCNTQKANLSTNMSLCFRAHSSPGRSLFPLQPPQYNNHAPVLSLDLIPFEWAVLLLLKHRATHSRFGLLASAGALK